MTGMRLVEIVRPVRAEQAQPDAFRIVRARLLLHRVINPLQSPLHGGR